MQALKLWVGIIKKFFSAHLPCIERRVHIKILFTAPIRTQAFPFICKTPCNVSVELSYPAHFTHKNPCKKTLKKYAFVVDRQMKVMYKSVSSSGSNSAVECNLAKVEVAGSNPVSRSKTPFLISRAGGIFVYCLQPLLVKNLFLVEHCDGYFFGNVQCGQHPPRFSCGSTARSAESRQRMAGHKTQLLWDFLLSNLRNVGAIHNIIPSWKWTLL